MTPKDPANIPDVTVQTSKRMNGSQKTSPDLIAEPEESGRFRRSWWTWHWDKRDYDKSRIPPRVRVSNEHLRLNLAVAMRRITRWRRGSLLTIYRFETAEGDIRWEFVGPFNLAISFGWPSRS